MSIDLLKKKVGIILEKRKLPHVVCEVKFALDISGSMENLYNNGTVQQLTDRLLAVASKFDDNGEMEVWTFTTGFSAAPTINENMHEGYVDKHILKNGNIRKWGGTSYEPVMADIIKQSFLIEHPVVTTTKEKPGFLNRLFGAKPKINENVSIEVSEKKVEHPIFVPFITDGENDDKKQTEQLVKQYAKKNIYWLMIGIGHERFHWLQKLADENENVGFMKIDDIEKISDEDFYLQLLNDEFCNWVKKFA